MTDWEDAYHDLGREMDAMTRGASSMEHEIDRMTQEIYDLRRENEELRRRIADLEYRCPAYEE